LALALAGLAWRPLRRVGFGGACLAYVALLLPVLPLRSHTYHYYLELPMLAAAWALALVFDAAGTLLRERPRGGTGASSRPARPALAVAVSWLLVLLFTINGTVLVRRCETAPFAFPGLLADPVMDRARIAQRV